MSTATQEHLRSIEEIFSRCSLQQQIPRLEYGIIHRGQIISSGEIRNGKQVSTNTQGIFAIASMAKSFGGAAMLILRNRGLLSLDQPVTDFIPVLKSDPHWHSVTLFHLLTMQAGVPEDNAWADRQLESTDEEYTKIYQNGVAGGFVYRAKPGREVFYSNLSYMLLGRVISNASGQHAFDFIAENILEPLEMRHTGWSAASLPSELVVAGTTKDGTEVAAPRCTGDGALFGGLLSTVTDMCRWVDFLSTSTPDSRNEILSLDSREELIRGRVMYHPMAPRQTARMYGFGWNSEFLDAHQIWERCHSGGIPGYGSHMRFSPEHELGVVALANRTYAPVIGACREAMGLLIPTTPQRTYPRHPVVEKRYKELLKLIKKWDNAVADKAFASNFFLDNELSVVKQQFEHLRDAIAGNEPTLIFDRDLKGTIAAGGKPLALFSLAPLEYGRVQSVTLQLEPEI